MNGTKTFHSNIYFGLITAEQQQRQRKKWRWATKIAKLTNGGTDITADF